MKEQQRTVFCYSTAMTKPEQGTNGETKEAVYFYTPKHYVLDNFSAYQVNIWGKTFATAEHAYQWKKYLISDPELAAEIFFAKSPYEVKKLADAHKEEVSEEFREEKVTIMEQILRAKAQQHLKVRETLLESGDKDIVENSPTDSFWGIGPNGTGNNTLGNLWMKIREGIQKN